MLILQMEQVLVIDFFVTNHPKFSGLKQQIFILLEFLWVR